MLQNISPPIARNFSEIAILLMNCATFQKQEELLSRLHPRSVECFSWGEEAERSLTHLLKEGVN